MSARERLAAVEAAIAEACRAAGRPRDSVKLIAVSKTKPFAMIEEFAALGVQNFGENYAQEAVAKVQLAPKLAWHFLGNLQSNKAKLIAGQFALFHCLDSYSLAEKIARVAPQDCLIEVNISGETTKAGIEPAELIPLLEKLRALPEIRVRGLMCIPRPGLGRKPFADLRALMDDAKSRGFSGLTELSMGMSADFADAILEGATFVRVGTALFGERE